MIRRLRGFTGSLESADRVLLGSVLVLLVLGTIVVYGAGSYNKQALRSPFGQHFILIKHLFMIGIGGLLMLGLMQVDYHWLRRRWLNWGGLLVALVLMGMTLHNPDGRHINRWASVFGYSLQPVELAKLALILFMAERLTWLKQSHHLDLRNLALVLALGPLPMVFVLFKQPNFGNILTVGVTTLVLLLVAGVRWRLLGALLAILAVGGGGAYAFSSKLQTRMAEWLAGLQAGNYGFQADQSLIGLGAGGWRGVGVGHSHNKFFFLPESHTDFAFSVLGEEWGLMGTLLVITLVLVIAWRGYRIAERAVDPFGRFVATGVTTGLAVYGVVNIAMVTGLLPVVGVPLPFVSYGGTAMVAAMAALGLLLSIDRYSTSYNTWKRRWDQGGTPRP